MSFSTRAMVAAISAVIAPTMDTARLTSGAYANRKPERTTRYTPAQTMVAEWMRADTGVGPSIASGSQMCSGNWADLPIAPTISKAAANVISMLLQWRLA